MRSPSRVCASSISAGARWPGGCSSTGPRSETRTRSIHGWFRASGSRSRCPPNRRGPAGARGVGPPAERRPPARRGRADPARVRPPTSVVFAPMRLTLVRHATILVELAGTRILIDPAFDPAGSQPPVDETPNPVPNPLVGLPAPPEDLVRGVDAVIVTHLHQDHLDAT